MNVFLTGGSSGIGQRFKQHLESLGHTVYAPTRQELDLSTFDISTLDLGSYDCVILCAGVDTNGRQPFIKLKEQDFVNTVTVNLLANMRLVHKYVQQRYFKSWSKIIVIGSTIVDYVWPNFVSYGTSKVALKTFLESLDRELVDTNIGICQLHPGLTKTNFHFNRGNGPIEEKDILYNTIPHLTVDDLVPYLDQILTDRKHNIKILTVSS